MSAYSFGYASTSIFSEQLTAWTSTWQWCKCKEKSSVPLTYSRLCDRPRWKLLFHTIK